MKVGIVGLGLIGGSMAKAYTSTGLHQVFAADIDASILEFAAMTGAHQGILDENSIPQCELILLAVSPNAAIQWLRENAPVISKSTTVMDLCGTKRVICDACFPLAKTYGFTFVGGHPMAGNHNAGFKYARANLFSGAPMVLVPPEGYDMELLEHIKELLAPARFGKLSITTADKHDEIIAFTSQMCHVVSNAYIKSPTARTHRGFSAGSYKDLTRVAWLNPAMWTELILENRDYMLREMDTLIDNLQSYRNSIAANDFSSLCQLLDEGRKIKKEVDG